MKETQDTQSEAENFLKNIGGPPGFASGSHHSVQSALAYDITSPSKVIYNTPLCGCLAKHFKTIVSRVFSFGVPATLSHMLVCFIFCVSLQLYAFITFYHLMKTTPITLSTNHSHILYLTLPNCLIVSNQSTILFHKYFCERVRTGYDQARIGSVCRNW